MHNVMQHCEFIHQYFPSFLPSIFQSINCRLLEGMHKDHSWHRCNCDWTRLYFIEFIRAQKCHMRWQTLNWY